MFFKKKKYCKQHCDLERLQELNRKLKGLELLLNTSTSMPYGLPCSKYAWSSEYAWSWSRDYDILEKFNHLITYAMAHEMNAADFIKELNKIPLENIDKAKFLNDVGEFFIYCSNYIKTEKEIEQEIFDIKKEINKLKEKLGIS